ncbi:MAG: hypothetical protein H6672_04170 [Anaerolineaceae bacterium]|nr:hypothetical protein [Anaerolineaceae bacterium]
MKRLILILGIALFLSLPAAAQDETKTLRVDAEQTLGTISPYVYGANYGPWALVSLDMADEALHSGLTLLRFPAGNWGDQNNIRPEQLDLFMLQVHAWNAEPYITARLEGGTPEQAAELVRYANVEKGYGVRYWSIGNEPTLYDDYTIERFNQEWRVFAEAMRAVDPEIIFIGPEVHQYAPNATAPAYLQDMRDWVREFLKVNGDMVDIVSIHRYPFPLTKTSSTSIDELRLNAPEADTMIELLRQDIRDTVGYDMPVAVTEINSHWSNSVGNVATPDSFYNAIWWADVLGRFIREQVDIVNYFALAATGSGFGLVDRYTVRPTYYVYQLYQQFGTELVFSEAADNDVTVYAALRDDGALTLIVVNLLDTEQRRQIQLDGFTSEDVAAVWRFDADHLAEQIDDLKLTNGDTLTLPAQSVTLYIVPPA